MADIMSREKRSALMSRIRGRDTKPEIIVRSMLHRRGFRFRKHVQHLPGKPDIVFVSRRIVIFIEGDFWHGYRFPVWKHKLTPFWKQKIESNRARDKRVAARLRRTGWRVLRVWEHEVKKDPKMAVDRIVRALKRQDSPDCT